MSPCWTAGVLLRRLLGDGALAGTTHVVIDEVRRLACHCVPLHVCSQAALHDSDLLPSPCALSINEARPACNLESHCAV